MSNNEERVLSALDKMNAAERLDDALCNNTPFVLIALGKEETFGGAMHGSSGVISELIINLLIRHGDIAAIILPYIREIVSDEFDMNREFGSIE